MKSFSAMWIVVSRGMADTVMNVAREAGAKGGTIVPCRGTGHHDTHESLLRSPIANERELVMIVTPDEVTRAVALAINEQLKLDEPGSGLLLTLPICDARGLVI